MSSLTYTIRKPQLTSRLLLIVFLVAILLHLLFLFVIAPILKLSSERVTRTEVIQISQDELARMKQQIKQQPRSQVPLLSQELREEYKTKEAPKDADFIGAFNQSVPKQTMAGAQRDAPQKGGQSSEEQAESRQQEKPKEKVSLSKLGLGSKVLLPTPEVPPEERREAKLGTRGPKGPMGPNIPVGREDKRLERGPDNLLNAVESEYYSFFVRFEEPIVSNWYFLLKQYERKIREEIVSRGYKSEVEIPLTLEFILNRQGSFHSIDIIETSNVPTLDWATKEAVKKLGSLPNPPPGIFHGGQYFSYRLQFLVRVSDSPLIDQSPGLRWF